MFTSIHKYYFKKIALLGAPVAAGQIGHVATGFADSAMIGQLGTTQLAAASFALAIFFIPFIFGLGLTMGITPLVGNAHGQNNLKRCRSLLRHGLVYTLATSVLLAVGIYILSYFLDHMGQEPEVAAMAAPFFRVLVVSMVPALLFTAVKGYMEGLGRTSPPMVISLAMNILNIVLNYLLIYGAFGFPKLGLMGAGYATLISRIGMFVLIMTYAMITPNFAPYFKNLFRFRLDKEKLSEITKLGFPIGLQGLMEVGAFSGGAVMLGWISKHAISAHQIAIHYCAFTFLVASGIGTGATIVVSNLIGKNEFGRLRIAAHASFLLALVFMSITAVFFALFRHKLPVLFAHDPLVIEIAAALLLVGAIFQLSDGFQVVAISVLRGMEDVQIPTVITFIAYWVISLPAGYLFAFVLNLGPSGVWLGYLTGLTASSLLLLSRFNLLMRGKDLSVV